jgi:integrase
MPDRLAKKYQGPARALAWQFVFPGACCRWNTELRCWERDHCSPSVLPREFRYAVRRAGVQQHAAVRAARHAFATHPLQTGTDIRTLQELLGQSKVNATMIYTHVGDVHDNVRSALELLGGHGPDFVSLWVPA